MSLEHRVLVAELGLARLDGSDMSSRAGIVSAGPTRKYIRAQ